MTTACVVKELRSLGEDFIGAALSAKRLEKRRCNHGGSNVSAAECIKEILGETNQFNYCVATQDLELRDYLRQIPGVPLIYINRSVMILEPPSPATTQKVKDIEYGKTVPNKLEKIIIKKSLPTNNNKAKPKIKKRKAKQPNPLSCKKRKTTTPTSNTESTNTKKNNEKEDKSVEDKEKKNENVNNDNDNQDSGENNTENKKKRKRRKHKKSKNKNTTNEDSVNE